MRAGKLDQVVQLRRATIVDDGWGGQAPGPTETYATMRAQVIQTSTEEFIRSWGIADETAVIFRLRFIDDVTLADEVRCDGADFNIKEIKPIGRRRGIELRCVSKPPEAS